MLLFRIEPTGYMLALTGALRKIWPGKIDVVFMNRSLTQDWTTDAINFDYDVLPNNHWNAACSIRHLIKRKQPQLLHIAGWGTAPSLSAILTGQASGLPVIVDLDTWRGSPSRWRTSVKQLVYPRLFNKIAHFAPGGSRQAAYLRRFGVPDQKMTPINMTVDVTGIRDFLASEPESGRLFRQRLGVEADVPMVLFVGRLLTIKGIEDLLDAWQSASSLVPGMRLVIAGDGPERDRVNAAAAKDPSICAVGRLSGEEVWRAYSAADLVVAPSRVEPWGLVVNEAMATGTPVIVTDIFGCVGDLAKDGETAIVIPASSPALLAEAISRLAVDRGLRQKISSAASELVSGWTIENEAQVIKEIWMRALNMQKNGQHAPEQAL